MAFDVEALLRRDRQLNALVVFIIAVLLVVVGLFAYLALADVDAGDVWLFKNPMLALLIPAFMVAAVVYVMDTHRRVRTALETAHEELQAARADVEAGKADLEAAYERVVFAHEAATTMNALGDENAFMTVLAESVEHFDAQAAAVVIGDDVEIFAREDTDAGAAHSAALNAAVRTATEGRATRFELADGFQTVAVPLRVRGRLYAVACMLRSEPEFAESDEESLSLLGRVLELGLENRLLVREQRIIPN